MTVLPWTHTSLGSQASRRALTVTGVATWIAAEYTPHPIPTTTLTLRNYSPTQPSPRILAVLFFPRGHYGPAFVTYFDEQNANIDAGQLIAEKIVVSALTINKSVSVLFVTTVHFRLPTLSSATPFHPSDISATHSAPPIFPTFRPLYIFLVLSTLLLGPTGPTLPFIKTICPTLLVFRCQICFPDPLFFAIVLPYPEPPL
ncbi:hypothetical protein JB92DRAFT_3105103 [Gautieria morchelliformis]|nr:hypothetical protein JB92DRAFT_3105103 [Gautieria morchelliformis]